MTGEIVDGQCKAVTFEKISIENNIIIEKTLMVGDGGNDFAKPWLLPDINCCL